MYLYDCITQKVVTTGISDNFSTLASYIKLNADMELRQGDAVCQGDITGKIVIKDNFDRDNVSDVLFAEKCSMSGNVWHRLYEALNSPGDLCFYDMVPLDYKLYVYEP